jgi:hypothetical protein
MLRQFRTRNLPHSSPAKYGKHVSGCSSTDVTGTLREDQKYLLHTYMQLRQIQFHLGISYIRNALWFERTLILHVKTLSPYRGFSTRAGDRKGVQNIGVLITDSVSRRKYVRHSAYYARKVRERKETELFVIGVNIKSTKEISTIASQPKYQHLSTLKSFALLTKYSAKLAQILCWHINKHIPTSELLTLIFHLCIEF